MANKFQLPGAERFSQYLEEMLGGELTTEGPETVDWSYGIEYTKRWIIKLSKKIKIGEYYTFGPKPGETDFGREFRGRIPGYKNECVAVSNQTRPESKKIPEDSVSLVYANERLETQSIHEGPGKLVDTPWQRQDGHEQIPFP